MKEIILSYKESCELVQNRIKELSVMLENTSDIEVQENLKLRKNTLNAQLYHMREIIQILEGYQERIDLLEKKTHQC